MLCVYKSINNTSFKHLYKATQSKHKREEAWEESECIKREHGRFYTRDALYKVEGWEKDIAKTAEGERAAARAEASIMSQNTPNIK